MHDEQICRTVGTNSVFAWVYRKHPKPKSCCKDIRLLAGDDRPSKAIRADRQALDSAATEINARQPRPQQARTLEIAIAEGHAVKPGLLELGLAQVAILKPTPLEASAERPGHADLAALEQAVPQHAA